VLSFLTSFTLIAIFWHGNHRAFHYLSRFDGRLTYLMFLQLLCIACIPFPTAVVGEHVSDPVAQEFYFGAILVTGLATVALWWYVSSEPRLGRSGAAPSSHPPLPSQHPGGSGGILGLDDDSDRCGHRLADKPPGAGISLDVGLHLAWGIRAVGATFEEGVEGARQEESPSGEERRKDSARDTNG
jgi:hypothetical protein